MQHKATLLFLVILMVRGIAVTLAVGNTLQQQATAVAVLEPFAFDCATVSEIPPSECQALVSLYDSTDGAHWQTNSGWLVTAMPCSWQGVVCVGNHVTRLLRDVDNDGWYSASYPGFTQPGLYRAVIYAEDDQGGTAQPLGIEIKTGSQIFLAHIAR